MYSDPFLSKAMTVPLDPRYLGIMTRLIHSAEEDFDRDAKKLNPTADILRKEVYLISALKSAKHEYEEHPGEDREPARRQRILHQDLADFDLMMSTIHDYKPLCQRCRDDIGIEPDSSFFRLNV